MLIGNVRCGMDYSGGVYGVWWAFGGRGRNFDLFSRLDAMRVKYSYRTRVKKGLTLCGIAYPYYCMYTWWGLRHQPVQSVQPVQPVQVPPTAYSLQPRTQLALLLQGRLIKGCSIVHVM